MEATRDEVLSRATDACVDTNSVNTGICLNCAETVAGVFQDEGKHPCESCEAVEAVNSFEIVYAEIDGKFSELFSQ